MKNRIFLKIAFVFTLLLVSTFSVDLVAQCPMCRMSAETNLQNGGTEATSLNTGILYLLSLPYLMIGALAFLWFKNRSNNNLEGES